MEKVTSFSSYIRHNAQFFVPDSISDLVHLGVYYIPTSHSPIKSIVYNKHVYISVVLVCDRTSTVSYSIFFKAFLEILVSISYFFKAILKC